MKIENGFRVGQIYILPETNKKRLLVWQMMKVTPYTFSGGNYVF
jgi:hypothetical protein